MKKILSLLLLCLLTSCEMSNISNTIYISSYALDYKDGEFLGSFYVPTSSSIMEDEDEYHLYNTKEGSLEEVFYSVINSVPLAVKFDHVKSVVLTNNFLNEENIESFLSFIKNNNNFDFDFYIFSTTLELDSIFDIVSINDASSYYILLNNPSADVGYKISNSYHFLEFASMIENKKSTIVMPCISIDSNWNDSKDINKQLVCDTICIYKNNYKEYYKLEDYNALVYLDNRDSIYVDEYKILKYKYSLKKIFGLKIVVSINLEQINCDIEKIKSIVLKEITLIIDLFYSKNIDFLSIEDINYKFSKEYTINDLEIEIKA